MQRKNFSSGTRWEPIVGYSRAVKVGDFVFVSGTTASNKEGNIVGLGNPYLQTIQIIKNIQTALQIVGSCLEDVVRTRIYVTDINNWEKVGQSFSISNLNMMHHHILYPISNAILAISNNILRLQNQYL